MRSIARQVKSSGCWIFTHIENENQEQVWCLWYADENGEWCTGHKFPQSTKMVLDGKGGVWALCKSKQFPNNLGLWHVTVGSEKCLYEFPTACNLISDGQGGCWCLCTYGCTACCAVGANPVEKQGETGEGRCADTFQKI